MYSIIRYRKRNLQPNKILSDIGLKCSMPDAGCRLCRCHPMVRRYTSLIWGKHLRPLMHLKIVCIDYFCPLSMDKIQHSGPKTTIYFLASFLLWKKYIFSLPRHASIYSTLTIFASVLHTLASCIFFMPLFRYFPIFFFISE
jgi:hypothetical protein